MAKRYLTLALIIFVAGMLTGFIPKLIHQVRLENALEEYKRAYLERANLNIGHLEELKELLIKTLRGTTSAENVQISQRLSQIVEENETADEKLAKAKQKFCDLAEEEPTLCWEKQEEPAPPQGQLI